MFVNGRLTHLLNCLAKGLYEFLLNINFDSCMFSRILLHFSNHFDRFFICNLNCNLSMIAWLFLTLTLACKTNFFYLFAINDQRSFAVEVFLLLLTHNNCFLIVLWILHFILIVWIKWWVIASVTPASCSGNCKFIKHLFTMESS